MVQYAELDLVARRTNLETMRNASLRVVEPAHVDKQFLPRWRQSKFPVAARMLRIGDLAVSFSGRRQRAAKSGSRAT